MTGRIAMEFLAELGKAIDEATVTQKELAILDAHEPIEAIFTSRRVMAEAGRG